MQTVPASDPAALCFKHDFPVSIPCQPQPMRAVADIRVHLGVLEMDRVSVFLPG